MKLAPIILTLLLLLPFTKSYASNSLPSNWNVMVDLLVEVSERTDVPVEWLATFAGIESRFTIHARNSKSTAKGLFQFTAPTWRTMLKRYGGKYGLSVNTSRSNPRANALMGAEYIKENRTILKNSLKREPTLTEIYTAHMLSPRRASEVAKTPERYNAAAMYPSIANLNSNIFYHRNGTPVSVGQLKGKLNAKVVSAMNTYGKPVKLEMVARNKPKSDVVETVAKTDLSRWTIRVDVATLNLCETEVLPEPFRGSLLRYTPTCKVATNDSTHIARVNHPFTITRRQFN